MKYLLLVYVVCAFTVSAQSQKLVIGRNPKRFINGIPVSVSTKHDSAMKYYSGVIGNSFYGPQSIGLSSLKNSYWPINSGFSNGFKRIQTGVLRRHYIRRTDGYGDDDVNFALFPNLSDAFLSPYIKSRQNDPPSNWTDAAVIAEIDVPNSQKKNFFPYLPHMPLVYQDVVNAYGPFVHDAPDGSHDYVEIHPAEQLWWVRSRNIGFGTTNEYTMILAGDDSERFLNGIWQTAPLPGVFAIAFAINISKERLRMEIETINEVNVKFRSTDGRKHSYRYGNIPIIEVIEPEGRDIMNVSFQGVYIDRNALAKGNDTILKGFITINSSVGEKKNNQLSHDTEDGNLILKATTNVLNKNWTYAGQNNERLAQVKVSLDKITVLKEDDFRGGGKEDLYGYIFAGVSDPTYKLPNSLFLPVESINPAKGNSLWHSLDDNNDGSFNSIINLGTGETRIFNESRLFVVSNEGILRLVADLNEDDGNTDNNPTTAESEIEWKEPFTDPIDTNQQALSDSDADDMLEKYYKVYDSKIPIKTLQLNVPLKKVAKFGSGKTEVEVHFTVTRLK